MDTDVTEIRHRIVWRICTDLSEDPSTSTLSVPLETTFLLYQKHTTSQKIYEPAHPHCGQAPRNITQWPAICAPYTRLQRHISCDICSLEGGRGVVCVPLGRFGDTLSTVQDTRPITYSYSTPAIARFGVLRSLFLSIEVFRVVTLCRWRLFSDVSKDRKDFILT